MKPFLMSCRRWFLFAVLVCSVRGEELESLVLKETGSEIGVDEEAAVAEGVKIIIRFIVQNNGDDNPYIVDQAAYRKVDLVGDIRGGGRIKTEYWLVNVPVAGKQSSIEFFVHEKVGKTGQSKEGRVLYAGESYKIQILEGINLVEKFITVPEDVEKGKVYQSVWVVDDENLEERQSVESVKGNIGFQNCARKRNVGVGEVGFCFLSENRESFLKYDLVCPRLDGSFSVPRKEGVETIALYSYYRLENKEEAGVVLALVKVPRYGGIRIPRDLVAEYDKDLFVPASVIITDVEVKSERVCLLYLRQAGDAGYPLAWRTFDLKGNDSVTVDLKWEFEFIPGVYEVEMVFIDDNETTRVYDKGSFVIQSKKWQER